MDRTHALLLTLSLLLAFATAACDDSSTTNPGTDATTNGDATTEDGTTDVTMTDLTTTNDVTTTEDVTTADTAVADATTADTPPTDVVEDVVSSCVAPTAPNGNGKHNAGRDCMTCHATMSASRKWTVAGTLYDTITGTNPVAGATIVVTDAASNELRLVTATNGNFFTNQAVTLPLTVRASACPNDVSMSSTAATGACNSCHTAAMRIHLP